MKNRTQRSLVMLPPQFIIHPKHIFPHLRGRRTTQDHRQTKITKLPSLVGNFSPNQWEWFYLEYINQMFKPSPSQKKYARISSEKREKLIRKVMEQGSSVVKASKKLGIKISTAKLILKKYKETGVVFNKKMPNYKRKELRQPALENKQGEGLQMEMSKNQIASIEWKLENAALEEERKEEGRPYVGIFVYWPAFYYQI